MNKAITDGLILTPPVFAAGLNNWSSQDGRPGSDSLESTGSATLIASDPNFGGCLELEKTEEPQRLRAFAAMPILPGCYVRITLRVKAISGPFPSVRIGATPVAADGEVVPDLPMVTPVTPLDTYDDVVVVSAILGTGTRQGVDLNWDDRVVHAHVGLDLRGPNSGVVRIDDLQVEDVTGAFLRSMMDWVDVRDFGAMGDGVTDDSAAFEAADRAAAGREVLVSAGIYHLADHVTFNAPVRFEGRVTMPDDKRLSLVRNYDLPSYADAFGDEELGLRKAVQALFHFTDHDTLDLRGRRVALTAPLDVQAAVTDKTVYSNQRAIKNGQIEISDGSAFDTAIETVTCTFDDSQPNELTNVPNVASISVGSLVEGFGVGREVYVAARDIGTATLTLSRPLWGAQAEQAFTFRRFKYALDFSGFERLDHFALEDVELLLSDAASGILLPTDGEGFQIKDCVFTGPKDRGLTSPGSGCHDVSVDRCNFMSAEGSADVADRRSIAVNVNGAKARITDNRASGFRHFAILGGVGHLVTGNHISQGDDTILGQRTAALVLGERHAASVVMSNHIENGYLEWTNEHDGAPAFQDAGSFGGLQIIGNVFASSGVPASYAPIHVKPFGAGHFLQGLTITGNTFTNIGGQPLTRVDFADDTHASLDADRFLDVTMQANTFQGVLTHSETPTTQVVVENTAQSIWETDLSDVLPFGGKALAVDAVCADGAILSEAGSAVWAMPYATTRVGTDEQSIRLTWPEAVKGKVIVTVRSDRTA
ncbi:MAG: glycosyl hydrolase family 28-related protein [Pseudomonadota bacterium]